VGSNPITVRVTAENGTTKDYTITVARAGSSNANLGSHSVSPGSLNAPYSSSVTAYTVNVANGVSGITVNAGTAHAGASAVLTTGGTLGNPISLNVGSNTITVTVTAENGSATRVYTINVTRAAADSTNAQLAGITINGVSVPGFVPSGGGPYNISVPNTTGSVTVAATAEETGTVITLPSPNPVSLSVGLNTITVTSTAPDNFTTKTYILTVTRNTSNNINVTITKANDVITLRSSTTNDRSRENNDTLVVTAPSVYSNYYWTVDGNYSGVYPGLNPWEVTVLANDLEIGSHSLRLEFYKDGVPFGSEVIFKVVR
jgi:hypothetical protein